MWMGAEGDGFGLTRFFLEASDVIIQVLMVVAALI